MEKPDLEQLMHVHEQFAADILENAAEAPGCVWVLLTTIQGEEVVKGLKERPDWTHGSFLFHYEWSEVREACLGFRHYYNQSRTLH